MQIKQGQFPIDIDFNDENQKNFSLVNLVSPKKYSSFEIPIVNGNGLVRNVLFVCKVCDGPLVPEKQCPVCNKTLVRKCTKCKTAKKSANHTICDDLVLLERIIKEKHKEEKS